MDGLSASSFARTSGRTGSFDFPGEAMDFNQNGLTDTVVAVGSCPRGTQLTGGGMGDFTSSGQVFVNGPDVDPESWTVAVAVDENATELADDVYASVICYNPTGAVAGSYGATQQGSAASVVDSLSPDLTRRLVEAAAAQNRRRAESDHPHSDRGATERGWSAPEWASGELVDGSDTSEFVIRPTGVQWS